MGPSNNNSKRSREQPIRCLGSTYSKMWLVVSLNQSFLPLEHFCVKKKKKNSCEPWYSLLRDSAVWFAVCIFPSCRCVNIIFGWFHPVLLKFRIRCHYCAPLTVVFCHKYLVVGLMLYLMWHGVSERRLLIFWRQGFSLLQAGGSPTLVFGSRTLWSFSGCSPAARLTGFCRP